MTGTENQIINLMLNDRPPHERLAGDVGDAAEAAVAVYAGSHSLGELELHARVAEEGAIVVAVGVDEAG